MRYINLKMYLRKVHNKERKRQRKRERERKKKKEREREREKKEAKHNTQQKTLTNTNRYTISTTVRNGATGVLFDARKKNKTTTLIN